MALKPLAAFRSLYRVTFGRLFPGLSMKICQRVFEVEYQRIRSESERISKNMALLESSLAHLYVGGGRPRHSDPAGGNAPLISVILPTHNRAHCIQDAVRSILGQQFQQWELIIVDDGSTDTTPDVVAPYLRDGRITYVRQEHLGHSTARNRALAIARGSIVTYLDSDNVALPDFLAAVAGAFTDDPATDFVYGALLTRHHGNPGGGLLWETFNREKLLQQNFIDLNAVAHRRVLFERYGGFDESLDRLTDWDLALRYTSHAAARPIAVVAAQYRCRDKSRVTDLYPLGPAYRRIRQKWALT
jgi:hypothetical protein